MFFGIIEVNYDKLECSKIYTNIMDPQGNLKKGNPMDLTIFILQVMYYITSYIFGIIDINYDKLDVSWSTQTSWTPKSSLQRENP